MLQMLDSLTFHSINVASVADDFCFVCMNIAFMGLAFKKKSTGILLSHTRVSDFPFPISYFRGNLKEFMYNFLMYLT